MDEYVSSVCLYIVAPAAANLSAKVLRNFGNISGLSNVFLIKLSVSSMEAHGRATDGLSNCCAAGRSPI